MKYPISGPTTRHESPVKMKFRICFPLIAIFLLNGLNLRVLVGADAMDALRQDLSMIFTGRQMADAQWGVAIYSLDRNEFLFEQNAHKLYVPASNEKLITAAAALMRLGPDYRFKTKVLSDGTIEDGVLRGNLIIQGFGDPSASVRMGNKDPFAIFSDWGARLKKRGIQAIAGGLVGDATAFSGPGHGRGWELDDLIEGYAAPVSALQFNENFVSLDIRPAVKTGAAATMVQKPLPDYLRLSGSVITRTGGERIAVARSEEGASRLSAGEAMRISGAIPLKNPVFNRLIAVQHPVRYYLEALRYQLAQEGIDTTNCHIEEAAVPKTATLLWTHESAPLRELLAPVVKESLNLPAETLLRALGREIRNTGTDAAGIAVVEAVLEGMGVAKGSYVYVDASGLSRRNLVSAEILVKVLESMRKQPTFSQFYSTLAIAGIDGTMKNRLRKTAAEGNVRAKTGTISSASSISGYIKTADGEMLAFSMIANNYPFSKATAEDAQNRALIRLASFSRK